MVAGLVIKTKFIEVTKNAEDKRVTAYVPHLYIYSLQSFKYTTYPFLINFTKIHSDCVE